MKVMEIFGQVYCLEIIKSKRSLAVDNGFSAAIKEILQVEDVIFT